MADAATLDGLGRLSYDFSRSSLRSLLGVACLIALGGCSPRDAVVESGSSSIKETAESARLSTPDEKLSPTAGGDPAGGESSPPEIPLEVASWERVEELIQAAEGKIVVVDIWSTWCIPCVREFPGLVELHQKYPDDVACLSVNLNYSGGQATPESFRGNVMAFLRKQRATFPNVISSEPDEALYQKLAVSSVPVILVYDRGGELRKRFDNAENEFGDEGFTYQRDIIPFVEQLLRG